LTPPKPNIWNMSDSFLGSSTRAPRRHDF